MQRKSLLVILVAIVVIFVGYFFLINKAEASWSHSSENVDYIVDSDGKKIYTYELFFTIDGASQVNHTDGLLVLTNLEVLSFEAKSGFILDYFNENTLEYSLTSNKVFTASTPKVVYARVTVKQVDIALDCSFKFQPNKTNVVATNDADIVKTAVDLNRFTEISQVKENQEFYYKIEVINNSVIPTDEVTISDDIPKELQIVSTDGEVSGQNVSWTLSSLAVGETKTFYVLVKVVEGITNLNLDNTAVLTIGDNVKEDSAEVEVLRPNLIVRKVASKNKLRRDEVFNYKITITNNGNGVAENVILSDRLNSNLEFISVNHNYSYSNNILKINVGDMAAQTTQEFVVTVKVKETAPMASIVNTAEVEADNHDPISDEDTVEVLDSEIEMVKSVSKTYLLPNEEFKYVITVRNTGKAASQNIVITDVIDERLEIVDSGVFTNNNNSLSYNLGVLEALEEKSLEITVKVKANITNNAVIENVAVATEEGKDPIESEVDVIVKRPILEITKVDEATINNPSPKIYRPGDLVTYVIRVVNNGSADSGKITVTDEINDLLTIKDASNGVINGQTITWEIANLAVEEVKEFKVAVYIADDIEENIEITNIAVLKNEYDEDQDDEIINVVASDIFIKKLVSKEKIVENETIFYTIYVENLLDEEALDLVVTDDVPSYFEIVDIVVDDTVTYTLEGNKINFNFSLGGYQNTKIDVYVKLKSNVDVETIKNVAILKFNNRELKSEVDVLVLQPKIVIAKESSIEAVVNNDEYYYTLKVQNVGEAPAYNLVVKDVFDEKLKIVQEDGGIIEGNTITWNVAKLEAGESFVKKIVVEANALEGDIIVNKLIVQEPGEDPLEDIVELPVKNYITINKRVIVKEIGPDQPFTYEIVVKNNSSKRIENVVVTDSLDSELIIVDEMEAQVQGNTLYWQINLESNEEKILRVTVKANLNIEKEKVLNVALLKHEEREIPSNEVEVIITVDNPQTGFSLGGILIVLGSLGGMYLIVGKLRRNNRFYKI